MRLHSHSLIFYRLHHKSSSILFLNLFFSIITSCPCHLTSNTPNLSFQHLILPQAYKLLNKAHYFNNYCYYNTVSSKYFINPHSFQCYNVFPYLMCIFILSSTVTWAISSMHFYLYKSLYIPACKHTPHPHTPLLNPSISSFIFHLPIYSYEMLWIIMTSPVKSSSEKMAFKVQNCRFVITNHNAS